MKEITELLIYKTISNEVITLFISMNHKKQTIKDSSTIIWLNIIRIINE